MCLLDVGVYVLALGLGWEPGKFLTPSVTALEDMGAKNAYKMQVEMEIWRWFCPVMLHANPAHLLFNLFLQAIIGYRLEPSVGWVDTAIVYWASGCGGVLLSALCSPTTLGVGASASILGLVTGTVNLHSAWVFDSQLDTSFWVLFITFHSVLAVDDVIPELDVHFGEI